MTEAAPLDGVGIVYFGNAWHAENRTSSHHIASGLSRTAPVLYVDSPGIRAPRGSGRDVRRAFRKLAAALSKPVQVAPGLWHCTVPQVPLRRLPGVDAFNAAFGRWAVRRAMRAVGFRRCISWFTVPHPGHLAGRLGDEFRVYYCTDDYSAFPGVDEALIAARDRELSMRADLLFVATPALEAPKRALNPRTVFSPHGVDVALFRQALDADTEVPAAVRDLPRPVIGYIGSIHEWVDLDLLAWLAAERPQWSFLMVGHAATDVSALRAMPNVRFVGPQPYAELGRWSKAIDVALIPQRRNRWIANANPLKLREYLAAGRPVVSVRNPEIEKFSRWVRIADDGASFLAAIEASLLDRGLDAAEERVAAVAGQTWEHRVDSVVATLLEHFNRHQPATT